MDQVLASEVLVVVLQKPDGLTFGDFRKLFFSTHGYPLDLSRYGYSSLQRLLDDVRELILVEEQAAQQPLIKCRSLARHQYLFLRVEDLPSGGRLHSTYVLERSPANSKRNNTSAIVKASKLIARTLSNYKTGLKLRKLKEAMWKEHGTDLEVLSKLIGSKDVIDFLHQLPNIKVLNPSKPNNCLIQLKEGLQNVPETVSSSQSSIASEVEIPTLSVVVREDPEVALEEHIKVLSNKTVVKDQQQHPNIRPLVRAKSKNYIFQFQEEIQKFSALLHSSLGNCPLGMRLRKLKDAAKKEYDLDLEKLSKDLGYTSLVDFLQQQPKVKLVTPGKTNNCVVQLQQDFKLLDFCEILNHNTVQQDSTTNQSASSTSKDTQPNSSTIPCKSSESPSPIILQHEEHNPTELKSDYFQPATHAKAKPKKTLPNKTAVPAKSGKNSFNKYSRQKQEHHLKKTSNTSIRSHVELAKPSLHKQQQERYIIPQVSRLRTPAISYSSAVSRTTPEAPSNRLALNNQMGPSSTNGNCLIRNQPSVMTHHEPTTFCLPISEFPQLTGKPQMVPPSSGLTAGNPLLTSEPLPHNTEDLRENILCVLSPHPNGVSLFQFQNTYRTMFNHKLPLNGYINVKQLLEEMEGVKVERIGIQDWVSLIPSDAVSTQTGLHSEPACEASIQDINVTTSSLNGLESSSRDEDQHKQAAAKVLTHDLSEIKKTQNIENDILKSSSTPQPLESNVPEVQNPSTPLDTTVMHEITKQMPDCALPSTQNCLQKQINATDDSSELSLEGRTPSINSHLPEVHLKAQTAENPYSSISPCNATVASSSFPSSEPTTALLPCTQALNNPSCIVVNHSATRLTVSTSERNNLTAEYHHGSPYRENTDIISNSSAEAPKDMRELMSNILSVLDQQPNGMSIFQLKKLYGFMFQHGLPLQGHCSVKQLLMAMPEAVKLRGLGIQMMVFPFSSKLHCSMVITEDNGIHTFCLAINADEEVKRFVQELSSMHSSQQEFMALPMYYFAVGWFRLLEIEKGTFPIIQDMAHMNIASSANMPVKLNPSLVDNKQKFPSISEVPEMCMPGNNPLDPEAPTFSPSSPLFADEFPSLQQVAVTSPLPLELFRKSDLSPSHCQTLTSGTALPYIVHNDNAIPAPGSLSTTQRSKVKGKAANSPSKVVCFKEHVDSPPCQNGRVNSAKQLAFSIMNHQDINSSQEAEFHEEEWPALSKDLFKPGANKKTHTDLIEQKINNGDTRTIDSNASKTSSAVKFVVFSDACNVKDLNTESYFYGSSSEIPTFGSVVLPLLGSQQNSPVEIIKKSHNAQNHSKGRKAL